MPPSPSPNRAARRAPRAASLRAVEDATSRPVHWTEVPQGALPELWLLGQPPLHSYLDHVRSRTMGGETLETRAICDEWRTANDRYHDLEEKHPGRATVADCRKLDPALAELAAAAAAHPAFRITFDALPTRFAMVELDRLVVFQRHVGLDHVDALRARLGPAPDPEAVFRACHPIDRPAPPIEVRKLGSRRYAFLSQATDLRFHQAALLDPARLTADQFGPRRSSGGPVGAMVGLAVGFGANFLNVLESDRRYVLHNGYHRAVALRSLGLTHAPCVVQTLTRKDELALVGASTLVEDPAFWFRAARPPLLRDFFDPALSKVLPAKPSRKMLEVSFEIREFDVAD